MTGWCGGQAEITIIGNVGEWNGGSEGIGAVGDLKSLGDVISRVRAVGRWTELDVIEIATIDSGSNDGEGQGIVGN